MVNTTNLINSILAGLILFSISPSSAHAQNIHRSSLGSNGTSTTIIQNGTPYHISQSIGQSSVISASSRSNHTVIQGFQQPLLIAKSADRSSNIMDVIVYPNPISTSLSIQVNEESSSPVDVSLYNITGLNIHNDRYEPHQVYQINMASFKSGIYILRLRTEHKIFTAQIVKE